MTIQFDFTRSATTLAVPSTFPVVLLHGSASGTESWTGLTGHIGARFPVTTPDLPGYGTAESRWACESANLGESAAMLLERVLSAQVPLHLVGHDFGAVLAAKVAAEHPDRVASLTLIEPTAFNMLHLEIEESWQIPRDLNAVIDRMAACLAAGDASTAIEHHTDFMNGPGTWERTSLQHRQVLTRHAGRALADLIAIEADSMTPVDLAGIVCPVLLISGGATRWPLQQVARDLHRSLPFVHQEIVPEAGHFPHLSDPHIVDPMIAEFLVRVDGQWQDNRITHRKAA